jgi:hypothetical protein
MPILAKFNLYRPDQLRVFFEVTEDTTVAIESAIEGLYASGYTINAGGLEAGESIEDITGWVLGETSRNEPVVWLYAAPLQFKVASIWAELIPEMPFSIEGAKMWPGAAPTLDIATNKGFLTPCSFQIVKKETGKLSDAGNPLSDYNRVYSAAVASETKAASPAPLPVTDADITQLRKRFHAQGVRVYGSKAAWDETRPTVVDYVSKGSASGTNDLTAEQLVTATDILSKRATYQPEPEQGALIDDVQGKPSYQ